MIRILFVIIISIFPIYSQPLKMNPDNDHLRGHKYIKQELSNNKNLNSDLLSRILNKQRNSQPLTRKEIFYLRNLKYNNYLNTYNRNPNSIDQSLLLSDSISLNWRTPYLENPTTGYEVLIDMVVDSLGNSYHLISSTYLPYGMEICLVKYNPDGEELWVTRFGSSLSKQTYPTAMTLDKMNNIYICGCTMPYNQSEIDMFIAQFDKDGDLLWSTTFNGENNNIDVAQDLVVDDNNDVIVSGVSNISNDDYKIVIVKYNAYQLEWVKYHDSVYSSEDINYFLYNINNNNLVIDHQENLIITQYTLNDYDNNLLIKYSNSGQELWTKNLDQVIQINEFYIFNVPEPKCDSNDNIYITLSFYDDYIRNCAIIKYNREGNVEWSKILYEDQQYSGNCESFDIDISDNGNIYICGTKEDDYSISYFFIVKYDSLGDELWIFDDDDKSIYGIAYALSIDRNENIYVIGNQSDITIITKLDSSGFQIWEKTEDFRIISIDIFAPKNEKILIGGTTYEGYWSMINKNILLIYSSTGEFIRQNAYVGPGRIYNEADILKLDHSGNTIAAGQTIDETGNLNILIVKFNDKGRIDWSVIYKDPYGKDAVFRDIYIDQSDNIFITGRNSGQIMKYNSDGVKVWQTISSENEEFNYAASKIIADNKGNCQVLGSNYKQYIDDFDPSLDRQGSYGVLAKYNTMGQLQWIKELSDDDHNYFSYEPTYMNIDLDGNIIVIGTERTEDYYDEYYNFEYVICLQKFNPDGKIKWNKKLNDESGFIVPYVCKTDNFGNILMVCRLDSPGGYNIKLTKWNIMGEKLWDKYIEDERINYHPTNEMQVDAQGYIYILGGGFALDSYIYQLIQINPQGEIQWKTDLDNGGLGLATDRNGNSYITFEDGTLSKYNKKGNLRWSENLENVEYMGLEDILLSDSADIIIGLKSDIGYALGSYSYFEVANFKQNLTDSELSELAMTSSGSWLNQNFPNPFNGITHFRYSIAKPEKVSLKVYNMLGQHVKTLLDEYQEPKEYLAHWIPRNVSNGTYFIQLTTKGYTKTKKVCYIK